MKDKQLPEILTHMVVPHVLLKAGRHFDGSHDMGENYAKKYKANNLLLSFTTQDGYSFLTINSSVIRKALEDCGYIEDHHRGLQGIPEYDVPFCDSLSFHLGLKDNQENCKYLCRLKNLLIAEEEMNNAGSTNNTMHTLYTYFKMPYVIKRTNDWLKENKMPNEYFNANATFEHQGELLY